MIMPDEKKNRASLILGVSDKEMPSNEDESDDETAKHSAMSEFIDAVHAKDAKAASEAFKACQDLHESDESENEESAEENADTRPDNDIDSMGY